MKTYEQMTQDVLARRDKELKDNMTKRRRVMMIGAPCAAALAIAAVCTTDIAARSRGSYVQSFFGPSSEAALGFVSGAHISSSSGGSESMTSEPTPIEPIDFTNPKSGQNDINVISVAAFNSDDNVKPDSLELEPRTMDQLYYYYRIEFDRLTKLHPDWTESHDPFGFGVIYSYTDETASKEIISLNTLNYITENGAKISVSAQYDMFKPLSNEMFAVDKPIKRPTVSEQTIYDDNGTIIGQVSTGYNPANDPDRPVNDEGVSIVNGYDAYIYRDNSGKFAADINMNSRVRITAEGLSEAEFLEILDEYTR